MAIAGRDDEADRGRRADPCDQEHRPVIAEQGQHLEDEQAGEPDEEHLAGTR